MPVFRARVAAAFRSLLPRAPERALVVAHKGVIATLIAEMLQLTSSERSAWPIDLASIHVVVAEDGRWRAEAVNKMRHLEGLP